MQPLPNPRHEQFAQRLASGETQTAAYLAIYTASSHNAQKLAHRLAIREDIADRVAEIQQAAATQITWTLAERLAFLRTCILAPPSQVDTHSPHCHATVTPRGTILKPVDKLKALELYSRLAGDLDPEPEPEPVSPLSEIIARIRAGKSAQY